MIGILCLTSAVIPIQAASSPSNTASKYSNVALKKSVTADSGSPSRVVDGDQTKFWESKNAPTEETPSWITVNLGKEYEIGSIEVHLPQSWKGRTERIRILISQDGEEFTELKEATDYAFRVEDYNRLTLFENIGEAIIATHVKLEVLSNSEADVAQIGEILVMGKEPTPEGYYNVALGKSAISDSQANIYQSPEKAVDGDLGSNSFWNASTDRVPNENDPNWITIDLGELYEIDSINVSIPLSWAGRTEKIRVLISQDGEEFTELKAAEEYTFNPQENSNTVTLFENTVETVTAMHVKLEVLSNTGADASVAQIGEIKIMGKETLTAEFVAKNIKEIPKQYREATKLIMPEIPWDGAKDKYEISIASSSKPEVVALDGTITPPQKGETVELVFAVTDKTTGEKALTKSLPVFIPKATPTTCKTINPEESNDNWIKNPYMGWVAYLEYSCLYHDEFAEYPHPKAGSNYQAAEHSTSTLCNCLDCEDVDAYFAELDRQIENGLCPNILYMRLGWNSFEPQKDVYAWRDPDSLLFKYIQGAKERGMQIAFRIIAAEDFSFEDNTIEDENQTTPAWLFKEPGFEYYDITELGEPGRAPYYDNEVYFAHFSDLVEELAKDFNDPNLVAYIDAQHLGLFGEQQKIKLTGRWSEQETYRQHAELWQKNFDKVTLLANFGFGDMDYTVGTIIPEYDHAFRRDGLGSIALQSWLIDQYTSEFLPQKIPFIGESCWWHLNRPHMKRNNADFDKEGNFVGYQTFLTKVVRDAKSLRCNALDCRVPSDWQHWIDNPELIEQGTRMLGYRLAPTKISYPTDFVAGEESSIIHFWQNTGNGFLPTAKGQLKDKYKISFALLDENNKFVYQYVDPEIDPSWLKEDGVIDSESTFTVPESVADGKYTLAVSIVDTQNNNVPGINLATTMERIDLTEKTTDPTTWYGGWYVIDKVNVINDQKPGENQVLDRIEVKSDKTHYWVGETFSKKDLVVTAHYGDGSSDDVIYYNVSGFDSTKAGNITITVSYTEGEVTKTADFVVTVEDLPETPAVPTADPTGKVFDDELEITLSCETEDADIYYTLDGSDPSLRTAIKYDGPFTIDSRTTLRTCAWHRQNSTVKSKSATFRYGTTDDLIVAGSDRIQAVDHDDSGGGIKNEADNNVGQFIDGGWMLYDFIDFGDTPTLYKIKANVSLPANTAGNKMEFYLDDKSTKIGEMTMKNTGGWGNYETQEVVLDVPLSGVHSLYVEGVKASGGTYVCNIMWFEFEAITSEITALKDIELETTLGKPISLPETVVAEFGDGEQCDVRVKWEDIPADKFDIPGKFTVTGTVGGTDKTVTATIFVNPHVVNIVDATGTNTQAAHPAYHAIDGNTDTTYWGGADGWPESLILKLDKEHALSDVEIYWFKPAERSYKYNIYVSQTGEDDDWTLVCDCSQNTVRGYTKDDMGGVKANFVKIEIVGRSTSSGTAAIYEVMLNEAHSYEKTVIDDDGYWLECICGERVEKTTDFTINVDDDIYDYIIPEVDGETNYSADAGDTVTLNIQSPYEYILKEGSLKYNDTVIEKDTDGNYTFEMPKADVLLTAKFIVDMSELENLIASCEDTYSNNDDQYTVESWNAYTDALAIAKKVAENEDSTLSEVRKAAADLVKATKDLVFADVVDKSRLKNLLDYADNLDTTGKRPALITELEDAIEAGKLVMENKNASEEQVNKAATDLLVAILNLKDIIDRSDIDYLIELISDLNEADFTEDSWQDLQDAIEQVEELNDDSSLEEVHKGYTDLINAFHNLEKVAKEVNKVMLKNALSDAKLVLDNKGLFIPSSIKNLQKVYDSAKAVFDNPKATQAQVDQATQDLTLETLKARVREDKELLKQTIAKAQAFDATLYTEASFGKLTEAVDAAKKVLEDEDATADEIQKALLVLEQAIAELEELETDSETYKPDTSTSGNDETSGIPKTGDTALPIIIFAGLLVLISASGIIIILKRKNNMIK